MADWAARVSGISTKPNPRDWPVYRSVMILIVSTTPYGSKSWRMSRSVEPNARLPTKIFTHVSFDGKHRNHRQVIRTVCRSNKRKSTMQEKRRENLEAISQSLQIHRIGSRQ